MLSSNNLVAVSHFSKPELTNFRHNPISHSIIIFSLSSTWGPRARFASVQILYVTRNFLRRQKPCTYSFTGTFISKFLEFLDQLYDLFSHVSQHVKRHNGLIRAFNFIESFVRREISNKINFNCSWQSSGTEVGRAIKRKKCTRNVKLK